MRPRRLALAATSVVVVAASQAGHLLALELRSGPGTAPALGGAHAYVPALATLVAGLAGSLLLAALLAVTCARVARAARGPGVTLRASGQAPLLDLAAVLFVLQLAIFLLQETIEAAVAGRAMPDVTGLLLWGCLGQLPAALIAAMVLSWLNVRLDQAVLDLAAMAGQALDARTALPPDQGWRPARPLPAPAPPPRAALLRGPPPLPGLPLIRR